MARFDRPDIVRQSDGVALFAVIYFVLFIFWLLLIGRIIVEFVRTFARDWRPTGDRGRHSRGDFHDHRSTGQTATAADPADHLGGVRLDLSIMVLLFIVFILMSIVQGQARANRVWCDRMDPMYSLVSRYVDCAVTECLLDRQMTREGILPCR